MAGRTSFALRVAAIPVLAAVIAIVEERHPFATFRLVTSGAAFFLLADIASLMRGNWRNFFVVLTSLALGLFLIETAANIRRITHDDVECYIQLTLAAVNLAEEKYGVPVIVLYFKGDEDSYLSETSFTTEAVLQRLRNGGAIVVDASLRKEQAAGMAIGIPNDGHPTALGNRLRAAILKNYLEQNMPSVLASTVN